MNYDGLPQHVLVKLLALDEAVAALKAGADGVESSIEDRRARLWGNVRRADDNPRSLEAELQRLLSEQKVLQQRLQAEQSVLSACKTWLDRLPADTKLEPVGVTARTPMPTPPPRNFSASVGRRISWPGQWPQGRSVPCEELGEAHAIPICR